MNKFKWINIFIRDIFLSFTIIGLNWILNYGSWFAALLMGMQIVMVTWHLHDFIKLNRRINNGIYRPLGDILNSNGSFRDYIQQDKESGVEGYFGRD